MIILKGNQQRVVTTRHQGDLVIEPKGTEALSQEIIPVIGGWTDYTGSGGPSTKQQLYGTTANELWGTDAWAMTGIVKPEFGVLGQNIQTKRLRQKKIYLDLTKKN